MNKKHDAILILGGGLTEQGDLPGWVKARLELSLAQTHGTPFFIPLSAGTTHKAPPLNAEGFPVFESQVAAQYLMSRGMNPQKILMENASYDTIGNAYFARVIHTDPRSLRRLLVVTSEFHLVRTKAIFEWVFGLSPNNGYELDFLASENSGLSTVALTERNKREKESIKKLQKNVNRISTLADFHAWLFSEHDAYATGRQKEHLSGEILSSY